MAPGLLLWPRSSGLLGPDNGPSNPNIICLDEFHHALCCQPQSVLWAPAWDASALTRPCVCLAPHSKLLVCISHEAGCGGAACIEIVTLGQKGKVLQLIIVAACFCLWLAGCLYVWSVFPFGPQRIGPAAPHHSATLPVQATRDVRVSQASVLRLWVEDRVRQCEHVEQRAQAMAVALADANGSAASGVFSGSHPSILSGSLEEAFRGWGSASSHAT